MSGDIPSTNISFSDLSTKWGNKKYTGGTYPGIVNISLSEFRGAEFGDDTSVPSSGAISINTHFRNKRFKGTYGTNDFYFASTSSGNDVLSGEIDRLYPVSSTSSTSHTNNSKIARLFDSNVSYDYPSILICPNTSYIPDIYPTDSATIWIKIKITGSTNTQIGILHKQGQTSWKNVATNCLRTRHTTYNDRIALHTHGYITHAGHIVENANTYDEITETKLSTNFTTSSNYHNRIGTTSGSGNGFSTTSNTYYYQKTNFGKYNSYTGVTDSYYIGMILNYYSTTISGDIEEDENQITNITIDGSSLSGVEHNICEGMYITGSGIPSNTIVQSISGNTIVMGDEITGTGTNNASVTNDDVSIVIFGQKLHFEYSNSTDIPGINIGPSHIILPRYYRTSASGSNTDIESWAFYVGDSTGNSNTCIWEIQSSNVDSSSITSSFLEISNRFIVDTSSSDYTGAYDVSQIIVPPIFSSNYYRIYIGAKITASTTYFNDIIVAGVQVLDSSNNIQVSWIFNTTSGDNWQTYGSQTTTKSSEGFPVSVSTAKGYTYNTITSTTSKSKTNFSYTSSTNSSNTGAAGGISGSTGIFPVGNGTISQVGASKYLYREASGSTRYSGAIMRSPTTTLQTGYKIRVVHLVVGPSGYSINSHDSLYMGIAIDSDSEEESDEGGL
tara:strand:+ start:315 stop:2327 length:2013 start_codon:yes stop_codon:yes gene_type:complete